MTAPSSLPALIDALGEAALRGEISWQAADRALALAEKSAVKREREEEQREWLFYAERVRNLNPGRLHEDQLERELHLVRAYQLEHPESDWLRHWEAELVTEMRQRWDSVA